MNVLTIVGLCALVVLSVNQTTVNCQHLPRKVTRSTFFLTRLVKLIHAFKGGMVRTLTWESLRMELISQCQSVQQLLPHVGE